MRFTSKTNMFGTSVSILLLPITMLAIGCTGHRLQYNEGTFTFDWRKQKPVTVERKENFERQYARHTELLKVKLQDGAIIEAVRQSNENHRGITQTEIEQLDRKWQNSGNEIMAQLTHGQCNNLLKAFQNSFSGFAEIFIADTYGLNVCQTNKTSDYYQADEAWWEHAFEKGKTNQSVSLEFDESAGVFAVPIYLPLRDPATGNIIGAVKAVVVETRSPQ